MSSLVKGSPGQEANSIPVPVTFNLVALATNHQEFKVQSSCYAPGGDNYYGTEYKVSRKKYVKLREGRDAHAL